DTVLIESKLTNFERSMFQILSLLLSYTKQNNSDDIKNIIDTTLKEKNNLIQKLQQENENLKQQNAQLQKQVDDLKIKVSPRKDTQVLQKTIEMLTRRNTALTSKLEAYKKLQL